MTVTPAQARAELERRRQAQPTITPAQAQAELNQRRRPISRPEAFARNAVDAATIGASDEIAGGLARFAAGDATAGASQLARAGVPMPGLVPAAYLAETLADMIPAVGRTRDARARAGAAVSERVTTDMRRDLASAQRQHPVTSIGGTFAGALPSLALGGGAPAARLGGRMLRGGAAGAAAGGAYGFNSGQTAEQRLEMAGQGGLMGFGVGAAMPALSGAVGRIGRVENPTLRTGIGAGVGAGVGGAAGGVYGALTGDPNAALTGAAVGALGGGGLARMAGVRMRPNSVGSLGGNLEDAPRSPTNGDRRQVVQTLARLAERSLRDEAAIERAFDDAASAPRGQVAANLLGISAERRARTLADMPGETAEIARRVTGARRMGNLERIGRRISGDNERDALEVLGERVTAASQRELEPLFRQAPMASRRQAREVIAQLNAHPEFADALPIARRLIRGLMASRRNPLPAGADEDPLYLLHYTRIALQGVARDPTALRNSAARIDNATTIDAIETIRDELDTIIPGYRNALGTLEAEILPRSAVQAMAAVQRPERTNIAGRALANPSVQRAIRQNRAGQLETILREEDDLFERFSRMTPGTNSQTAERAFDAADQVAFEMPRVNINPMDWANRALGVVTDPFRQQRRNLLGRALYQPVDPGLDGYDPRLIAEMRAYVAQEMARRRAATRGAIQGGAGLGGGAAGVSE